MAPQTNSVSHEMAGVGEGSLRKSEKESEAEPTPLEVGQTPTRVEQAQAQAEFQIPGPTQIEPFGELNPAENVVLEAEAPTDEIENSSSWKSYLFQNIKALTQEGLALRAVATELGVSRQTVRKYAKAEKLPAYSRRPLKASKLDLYKPYFID